MTGQHHITDRLDLALRVGHGDGLRPSSILLTRADLDALRKHYADDGITIDEPPVLKYRDVWVEEDLGPSRITWTRTGWNADAIEI